jgi:integrase
MNGGTINNAVRERTHEALGFPVNLHRFRRAAATLWSVQDPANVRGVKDLLGHASFGTTEKYYIMAQTRPSPVMNVRRPIIGSPHRRSPTAFPGW